MRCLDVKQLKLCLVTRGDISSSLPLIHAAVLGGVTMVQLRDKCTSLDTLKLHARRLQTLLHPYNVPLIINDHVALAKEIDADGVHLGQSDMPIETARSLLGDNKIIGLSIESHDNLMQANASSSIDYVSASAVYASTTKSDCTTHWGIAQLRELVAQSKHPMTAIGGITGDNAQDVFATGVCGIAVVSAIYDAQAPEMAAQHLINKALP